MRTGEAAKEIRKNCARVLKIRAAIIDFNIRQISTMCLKAQGNYGRIGGWMTLLSTGREDGEKLP